MPVQSVMPVRPAASAVTALGLALALGLITVGPGTTGPAAAAPAATVAWDPAEPGPDDPSVRWVATKVPTPGCGRVSHAEMSTTGKYAYLCGSYDDSQAYLLDPGKGRTTPLSSSGILPPGWGKTSDLAWDPTGTRIALVTTTRLVAEDPDAISDVYVYDTTKSGSKRWRLISALPRTVRKAQSSMPVWSPNGHKLVWSTNSDTATDRNDGDDLYITDVRTWKTVPVNVGPNGRASDGATSDPSWSPDSRRLAYTWLNSLGSHHKIRVLNLHTMTSTLWSEPAPTATGRKGPSTTPVWDGSGTWLAFETDDRRLTGTTDGQVVARQTADGPVTVLSTPAPSAPRSDGYSAELVADPAGTAVWAWITDDQALLPDCGDYCSDNAVEYRDGQITVVSMGVNGRPANEDVEYLEYADGGGRLFFQSYATNLSSAARGSPTCTYAWQAGGALSLVNVGANGERLRERWGNGAAPDGSFLISVAMDKGTALYRSVAR